MLEGRGRRAEGGGERGEDREKRRGRRRGQEGIYIYDSVRGRGVSEGR